MTPDLLIIGGGINGAAIAREAAVGGLSVLLVERDDIAAHTSSASSGLIHGGLRYLEYYAFRLVREALHERERLMKAAPHLIRPTTFVLPDNPIRPRWMIRAGLMLYDWLAGRTVLPRARRVDDGEAMIATALQSSTGGHAYADCTVDDARLTLANAIDAADNGAEIATRTALLRAERRDGVWHATLSDGRQVTARALVNAAGPWVIEAFGRTGQHPRHGIRLIKGSHIVVPRLYGGEQAYILQQPDRRIVFAVPWQGLYTMLGTTDVAVERPEDAVIDADEIAYLCAAANRSFIHQIGPGHVIDHWSGVRALRDDGAGEARAVTRDYVLEVDGGKDGTAPMLSVFGGKITTARALAEEALAKLAPILGHPSARVTRDRPFPGGDIARMADFVEKAHRRWPFIPTRQLDRMARAYGTRLFDMLAGVTSPRDMGRDFGEGLHEVELRWMRDREWAMTADDALWRRSKLGLHLGEPAKAAVAAWFERGGR